MQKLNISLTIIAKRYPVKPKIGNRKYKIVMVNTKSKMLQNITLNCLFFHCQKITTLQCLSRKKLKWGRGQY